MTTHGKNLGFIWIALTALFGGSLPAADPGSGAATGMPIAVTSAAVSSGGSVADPLLSGYVEVEKVRMVLLPTKVEDRKGRIIVGLTESDFNLMEDFIPQKIQFVSVESDSPVSMRFCWMSPEACGSAASSTRPRKRSGISWITSGRKTNSR